MRSGDHLCTNGKRWMWHGYLFAGFGVILPERHDDGDLHDTIWARLLVYGEGQRYTTAFDYLFGEPNSGDLAAGRHNLSGELSAADGDG